MRRRRRRCDALRSVVQECCGRCVGGTKSMLPAPSPLSLSLFCYWDSLSRSFPRVALSFADRALSHPRDLPRLPHDVQQAEKGTHRAHPLFFVLLTCARVDAVWFLCLRCSRRQFSDLDARTTAATRATLQLSTPPPHPLFMPSSPSPFPPSGAQPTYSRTVRWHPPFLESPLLPPRVRAARYIIASRSQKERIEASEAKRCTEEKEKKRTGAVRQHQGARTSPLLLVSEQSPRCR